MLDRRHIDYYAYTSGIDRSYAEKDIVLTYALKVLSDGKDPLLHHLAFKGGTCMKKIYLGKTGRFSTDLDFTSLGMTRPELESHLEREFYGKTHYGITFELVEDYPKAEQNSYGAIVEYSHSWNRETFKLEVSLRGGPLLKVNSFKIIEEQYFKYLSFKPFMIQCLQKEELVAEKIRAAFQRMGIRDLFDLYLFSAKPYNRELAKKLVVIKLWEARDPFDPSNFFRRIEKETPSMVELRDLIRKDKLPTKDDLVEIILRSYSYLRELNDELETIVADSAAHRKERIVESILSQVS